MAEQNANQNADQNANQNADQKEAIWKKWVPKSVRGYLKNQSQNQNKNQSKEWIHYVPKKYRKKVEEALKNQTNGNNEEDNNNQEDNNKHEEPPKKVSGVSYTAQLTQCLGLARNNDAQTWQDCQYGCSVDTACEVWQFGSPRAGVVGCWSGTSDKCDGGITFAHGGRKVKSASAAFLASAHSVDSATFAEAASGLTVVFAAGLAAFVIMRLVTVRRVSVPTEALG